MTTSPQVFDDDVMPSAGEECRPSQHGGLWHAVDRLVDRARSADDVRAHRLELLALSRWRATGRPIPPDFELLERRVVATSLAVPLMLSRIRSVVSGPLLVMKGPEVAARYPRPSLRSFNDLDLLVVDPAAAQRQLVDAGFELVGDERIYRGIHHVRPVHLAGMPVVVELHDRLKWIEGLPSPAPAALLAAGVPSAIPVDGLLALRPAQHAIVLAAHSWAHQPLRRLGDLVDIAAVAAGASEAELRAVAHAWRVDRLWDATARAIAGVLGDAPSSWPLRTWARNLPAVRDRTVLESHAERWLSGFAVYPPQRAAGAALRAVAVDLRPDEGETWRDKARRSSLALRNAFVGRRRHDEELRRQNEEQEMERS